MARDIDHRAPTRPAYLSDDGEPTVDDGTPPPPAFLDELAVAIPDDDDNPLEAGAEPLNFEPPTHTPRRSLAHPRLVPRSELRARFPRASSPMPARDSNAVVCLPSPIAHPKAAPMFLHRRSVRR